MKIGGLQKVSLSDYPGRISAVVFTQGCNFRCPYCHNPELVDPRRFGPPIPEREVLSFLRRRKGKLDAVVVTGGEPLLQEDLPLFLGEVKEMGYMVKVDTNGSRPDALFGLLRRALIDYLAMDLKGPLRKYERLAGAPVDGDAIRRSVEGIRASSIPQEFRTTFVPSLLDLDDLIETARLIPRAPLYVLQGFVPRKPLEPRLCNERSPLREELLPLREEIEKIVGRCEVRL